MWVIKLTIPAIIIGNHIAMAVPYTPLYSTGILAANKIAISRPPSCIFCAEQTLCRGFK